MISSRKKTVIFSKSRKQPSLSAASPFLHLSRYVSVSETFPFQAKRREKAENTTWMMKVLCLISQSVFRTRRVDPYLENVCRRSWCFSATSTVAILSTPTCCLLAQKTGVCYKMSSGTDKNINKAFVFFHHERVLWQILRFEAKFLKGLKRKK